jgi:glucose-1-phosphate thymidylyltransferase
MVASKYQGVILAAGHGSRMGPFGDSVPKPVAPICNKPLLAYQLDYMKSLGIDDIIIVIGHLGHRIQETLGDGSAWGVTLKYVEQQERLGLAHAVGQLESHIDRPFLLMLGDIFFEMENLGAMAAAFEESDTAAVLAVKQEPDVEAIKRNFAVLLHDDGTVRRVIEKPRNVPNKMKGCGIYLFDDRIFEAIRRTPRTAMRDEYELTDSIQILIDYEYPVKVAEVVQWDINLTFIGDLVRCCRHQLEKLGETACVGDGSVIPDGAELVETVIGSNVTLKHPIRMERCVVLDGVTITGNEDIADAVITADGILH